MNRELRPQKSIIFYSEKYKMSVEYRDNCIYVDGKRYIISEKARAQVAHSCQNHRDFIECIQWLAQQVFELKSKENDNLFFEYPESEEGNVFYRIENENGIFSVQQYEMNPPNYIEFKYRIKNGRIVFVPEKLSGKTIVTLVILVLLLIPASIVSNVIGNYFPVILTAVVIVILLLPKNNLRARMFLKKPENYSFFVKQHCKSMK